jgi:hypothetical protein
MRNHESKQGDGASEKGRVDRWTDDTNTTEMERGAK